MISSELLKARNYETEHEKRVRESDRPVYHLTARIGWLNDPNGFSYYDGKYHLFYQYHPYNTYWGPMHWGHAVSDDMIDWKYLPAAMAPDKDYDMTGCFSGSAARLDDGRLLIMYTGCEGDGKDPLGQGRWRQSQCAAVYSPDTGEVEKYDGNPVIGEADMPEGSDPYEFRDPYLWRAADGSFRVLVAAGRKGGFDEATSDAAEKGTELLLYRSDDGFDWTFDKILFEDDRRIGIMWECPNFLKLGDRHILVASPMDMILEQEEADGTIRFPKGNNVCYVVGDYDLRSEVFIPDKKDGRFRYEPVDSGLDFYAPQITKTADGREVMIAWMQDPAMANLAEPHEEEQYSGIKHILIADADGYVHGQKDCPIFCQMTVPREIRLDEGRLVQWPVREFDNYRGEAVTFESVHMNSESISLDGISGRSLDINIDVTPETYSGAGMCSLDEFSMRFAEDEEHCIEFSYRPDSSVAVIDRSHSGQSSSITKRRSTRVRKRRGEISLRILIDRWSAEIFINGGEQVISLTFYTPLEAEGISFRAEGSAYLDVTSFIITKDQC